MQKFGAFCLAVAVGLFFLSGCRRADNGGAHLVEVAAEAVPAAASAVSAASAVGSAASAVGAGAAASSAADGAGSRTAAVLPGKSGAVSETGVSPASSGGGKSSAAAGGAGGKGGSSSSAAASASSSGAAPSAEPTLAEAVDAVNAALDRTDAQPSVTFCFTDSLTGAYPQSGTASYNNCPSRPVFRQAVRLSAGGRVTETDVCCDGSTMTCSVSSGGGWTRPFASEDLAEYVRILTPRLSAGRLSSGKAVRLDGGGLTLEAEDAAGGYEAAARIAGLPDARVTAVSVCYTVGAAGRLDSSRQQFTLQTDSGARVFTMEKQYQW